MFDAGAYRCQKCGFEFRVYSRGRAKLVGMELERTLDRRLSPGELADVASLGLLILALAPPKEVADVLREKVEPLMAPTVAV